MANANGNPDPHFRSPSLLAYPKRVPDNVGLAYPKRVPDNVGLAYPKRVPDNVGLCIIACDRMAPSKQKQFSSDLFILMNAALMWQCQDWP